ncbi:hypothetical protein HK096_002641, partial [Nowakowskiella sp. JEL0078]
IQHDIKLAFPLRHQNVLQVFGLILDSTSPLLALEYVDGGSLRDFLEKQGQIQEFTVLKFLSEISSGMMYLHERNPPILHGDLKASNILLWNNAGDVQAKITNFGISKIRKKKLSSANKDFEIDDLRWMAPGNNFILFLLFTSIINSSTECLSNYISNRSVDVFAFSMTGYEILTVGKLPFELDSIEDIKGLQSALLSGKRPIRPNTESFSLFRNEIWTLLEKCWNQLPERRPSFRQIFYDFSKMRESSSAITPRNTLNKNSDQSTFSGIEAHTTFIRKYDERTESVDSVDKNETISHHGATSRKVILSQINEIQDSFAKSDDIPMIFTGSISEGLVDDNINTPYDSRSIAPLGEIKKVHFLKIGVCVLIILGSIIAVILGLKIYTNVTKKYLALGSNDGTISVYELDTSQMRLYNHSSPIYDLQVIDRGRMFSGALDGSMKEWDVKTGNTNTDSIRSWYEHGDVLCSMELLRNTSWLFTGSWDNTTKIFDVTTGNQSARAIKTYTQPAKVETLTIYPGSDPLFYTGSNDFKIREYRFNSDSGNPERTFNGHTDWISKVKIIYSGTNPTLYSSSGDSTIREWDLNTGITRRLFNCSSAVYDFTIFDGNSPRIYAGMQNGLLIELDISSGSDGNTPLRTFDHGAQIHTVVILNGTQPRLFSGGDDGFVKEWDIRLGSKEGTSPIHIYGGHLWNVKSIVAFEG